MKFCSNCDNMLYLKINESDNTDLDASADTSKSQDCSSVCFRKCNEQYDSDRSESCVFNINFNST